MGTDRYQNQAANLQQWTMLLMGTYTAQLDVGQASMAHRHQLYPVISDL
ncbi:hypothetical protein [Legionella rowbothamii]|nr:hypothetical protein [Legionella rowbothamii]